MLQNRKIKSKTMLAGALCAAAVLGASAGVAALPAERAFAEEPAVVTYYNGGFWNLMLGSSDFASKFTTKAYDEATDTVHLAFDYTSSDGGATAWGPANAVPDEYSDWNGATSAVVQIKNNQASEAEFMLFFSGYTDATHATETHFTVGNGKHYYLKSKEGTVQECTVEATNGHFKIPASFDGALVMPTSEITGYWGGEVSYRCVKRVNFEFSGGYSKGDLTLGAVGYGTSANIAMDGVAITYDPMIKDEFVVDDKENDLKVLKNWLYSNDIGYFDGELKKKGAGNSAAMLETDDAMRIVYTEGKGSEIQLWCKELDTADRDMTGYSYLVIDVKNNSDTETVQFAPVLSSRLQDPKVHCHFTTAYLRGRTKTNENAAEKVLTEGGGYVTLPAGFDGYVAMEISENNMVTLWGGTDKYAPADTSYVNLFLKGGDMTFYSPMAAVSNKITDTTYEIGNVVNNDTKTVHFGIDGSNKVYDGQPLSVQLTGKYAQGASVEWYKSEGGSETKLAAAPSDAGTYVAKAKAEGYQFTASKTLVIEKASPAALIDFEEKTYHVGDKIDSLTLTGGSLAGTVTVTEITLVEGENEILFTFVPESGNYRTINASITVTAVKADTPVTPDDPTPDDPTPDNPSPDNPAPDNPAEGDKKPEGGNGGCGSLISAGGV